MSGQFEPRLHQGTDVHPTKRTIKLMWDYGCSPLWQHDGQLFLNVEPSTLPLSESTQARLDAWAAIPDSKLAEVEYPPDMKWTPEEKQSFEQEGRELLTILQRELLHDYYVVYHSTAERRVLLPEGGNEP